VRRLIHGGMRIPEGNTSNSVNTYFAINLGMCKESLTGYHVALSGDTEQRRLRDTSRLEVKELSFAKQRLENRIVNERAVHPHMLTYFELHNPLFTLT
jgi:hypothetical protein